MVDVDNDALFDEILPEVVIVKSGSSNTSSSEVEKENVASKISNEEENGSRSRQKQAKKPDFPKNAASKSKSYSKVDKIYKPRECMKYMNIEIHPQLASEWFMGDVNREAMAAGARVITASNICNHSLMMWSVTQQPTLVTKQSQVSLSAPTVPCAGALYIMTAEVLADHIKSRTLASHMAQVKELAGEKLTLVVFGLKEYFRSCAKKKNKDCITISQIDLEMAITDTLVSANCDTAMVNTPNELALLIVQVTKAMAEAPYKKEKRAILEQTDFYMQGDNRKCVVVDKEGNGLSRLWQQMIATLPSSSLETARALCAAFPTPRVLCENVQTDSGVRALSELGVARAAAPSATSRRLGPEFAKKLATLFTAEDGNTIIE